MLAVLQSKPNKLYLLIKYDKLVYFFFSDLQLRDFLRALQNYVTKKNFNSGYRLRSNEEQDNSLEKVTQHQDPLREIIISVVSAKFFTLHLFF